MKKSDKLKSVVKAIKDAGWKPTTSKLGTKGNMAAAITDHYRLQITQQENDPYFVDEGGVPWMPPELSATLSALNIVLE